MRKEILNLEEAYKADIASGMGFDIDKPIVVTQKENIRDPRGIYSSLFGGDISDVPELQRRWSCRCGKVIGKFRSNIKCTECGTKPEFQDDIIEKTGYISLKPPYVVINPDMYTFLQKIFKNSRLEEMLRFDAKLDKHGKVDFTGVKFKNKYANIGLVEFARNFDEILMSYLTPKNEEFVQFVMENRDKVFTSRIPVISILLRQVAPIKNTFNYDGINELYQRIVSDVDYINLNENEESNFVNLSILFNVQTNFNAIKDKIEREKLNGKGKFVRNMIFGARINFSARHVILSNADVADIDKIVLPYYTFCEFYKYHIMNIYRKIYKITVNELNMRWSTLVRKQDPSIMHIIDLLIKRTKGGLTHYINRNPTLRIGSSQAMTVMGIHKDINNLTMGIPLNSTGAPNADFDGDANNDVPIFDSIFAELYKKFFSPKRLIIHPAKNTVDEEYMLKQDQLLAVWSFFNDDTDIEDTMYDKNDNFSILTAEDHMLAAEYYKNGGLPPDIIDKVV